MQYPTERVSVQDRIIQYATETGWGYVKRSSAEKSRGFNTGQNLPREQAIHASLFFDDILFEKVKEFNSKYEGTKDELVRTLSQLRSDISGNRVFLSYLRGEKTFHSSADNREYNLQLIDYKNQANNIYHVTDEYYYFNGHYANREDIVFLINGIPILVIECKNATKDEAIAIGIDQLRR